MSDYTDHLRAFAQLNPHQYVPDTSDPVVFQAVTQTIEEDQTLGRRVMNELTLGENLHHDLRSDRTVPDHDRYATLSMAAVTWRARAAQQLARTGHLPDWQRRFGIPPDRASDTTDARTARRDTSRREAALALADETHGTPGQRAAGIAERATLAQQQGEVREAQLEARFAGLNPEFGVLPSRTDPDQHRFAHGRERALALGSRVHLAEARENTGNPELDAWQVRERALRAGRAARDQQPAQRRPPQRARAGVER